MKVFFQIYSLSATCQVASVIEIQASISEPFIVMSVDTCTEAQHFSENGPQQVKHMKKKANGQTSCYFLADQWRKKLQILVQYNYDMTHSRLDQ